MRLLRWVMNPENNPIMFAVTIAIVLVSIFASVLAR
jgi:hypothetical protein